MQAPFALSLAACLALVVPASGGQAPAGIAFVQAEEGTWWCRDSDPAAAFACATRQCAREANGQDCNRTRWCMPAAWSGLMVVWLPEFHATTIVCGVPSQAAATAALQALCGASDEFTRCDVVRFIDPDGGDHEVTDLSWPGPAASGQAAPP
jgi:hypothetical protein